MDRQAGKRKHDAVEYYLKVVVNLRADTWATAFAAADQKPLGEGMWNAVHELNVPSSGDVARKLSALFGSSSIASGAAHAV